MLTYVRLVSCQHTIKRKIVFLPIVARLECGSSPVDPKGRWEEFGSGLVAVYRGDWDRFRGELSFAMECSSVMSAFLFIYLKFEL